MKKLTQKAMMILVIIMAMMTGASDLMAQATPTITLYFNKDSTATVYLRATAENTSIEVTGALGDYDITVGTSWEQFSFMNPDGDYINLEGNINGLKCGNNNGKLDSIDISGNNLLKHLECNNNGLSTLNVSNNTALEYLDCSDNFLNELDISRNILLTQLDCSGNEISSLGVFNNTHLRELYCYNNDLDTDALDAIFCDLPNRNDSTDAGEIFPIYDSSLPYNNIVLATNKANATSKNWNVQYFDDYSNIPATNGSYVCPIKYDLKINSIPVTSVNCSDLSEISGVSGTVNFDPTTKILTLQAATINVEGESNAIVSDIDGLIVKVVGTNNVNSTDWSALKFNKPTTIAGEGTLNANSQNNGGIFVNKTNLTIDSSTVKAKGKWGITGKDGSSETLTIKNAYIMAEGAEYGSIVNFASLTLDGCLIYQPTGAAFDATKKAVTLGGEIVKSRVLIAPEPNMESYITLTVADGEDIKLDFIGVDIAVRIVSGSNTTTFFVDDWTGTETYTADGTEMKIYGDITELDCSENGENLTAIDVSKNTQLDGLYCYDNNLTTAALDDIYCALPDRTGTTNGVIKPVRNSSVPNHANILATNKTNATSKNWKVRYSQNNADIPATTGSYVCGTPHTDIAEAAAEQALTLYPNPVADVLYLSATARTIRVYNIYGIEVAHATDTDRVDVAHLSAGVYTVKADGTVAKMVKR